MFDLFLGLALNTEDIQSTKFNGEETAFCIFCIDHLEYHLIWTFQIKCINKYYGKKQWLAIHAFCFVEFGGDQGVSWSTDETRLLIEGWSRNAENVNLSRNESYMQAIADYIGSGKNAKQVRTKVRKQFTGLIVTLIHGCDGRMRRY